MWEPIPSQCVQAPNGELKENILGVSSAIDIPQWGQEKCSLNKWSLSGSSFMIMSPEPIFNANSTDSVNRSSHPFSITSRSITTSIVCFLFLPNSVMLLNEKISPSTLARKNPSFFISSNTPLCCPFLPLIIGASK